MLKACILSTLVISTLAHSHDHHHNETKPKFELPFHAKAIAPANPESKLLLEAIQSTFMLLKDQYINTNHSEVVKNVSALGFNNFVQDTQVNTQDGLDGKFFQRWADTVTRRIKGDNATRQAVINYI
jgi:hypothetical protein